MGNHHWRHPVLSRVVPRVTSPRGQTVKPWKSTTLNLSNLATIQERIFSLPILKREQYNEDQEKRNKQSLSFLEYQVSILSIWGSEETQHMHLSW